MLIKEFIHNPNFIAPVLLHSNKKQRLTFYNYQLRDGSLKIPKQNFVIKESYSVPTSSGTWYTLGFDSTLKNLFCFSYKNSYVYEIMKYNISTHQYTVKTVPLVNNRQNSLFYFLDDNTFLFLTYYSNARFGIYDFNLNKFTKLFNQSGLLYDFCCGGFKITNLDTQNKTVYIIASTSGNDNYHIGKLHYDTGHIEDIYAIPNSHQLDPITFIKIGNNIFYENSYHERTLYKYPHSSIFKYSSVSSTFNVFSTLSKGIYTFYGWSNYDNNLHIIDWNTYAHQDYILTDINGNRIQNFGISSQNGNSLDADSNLWVFIENVPNYANKLCKIVAV